jgi:hypothetical protein
MSSMSLVLEMKAPSRSPPSKRSGRRRPRVWTRCQAADLVAGGLEALVRLAEHDALAPAACTAGRRAAL